MTAIVTRAKTLVLGQDEDWPAITRAAILAGCREGVRPFCGRGPMKAVGAHFRHRHGVHCAEVREHYGFNYRQAFATPEFTARLAYLSRQRLIDRPEARAPSSSPVSVTPARHVGARRHSRRCAAAGRKPPPRYLPTAKLTPRRCAPTSARRSRSLRSATGELCADLDWLDAKRRRIPSSEREEIVRRWLAGASAAELARSCKVDPATIRNIVAEQGDAGEHGRRLPRRRYLLTVEQEDELVRRRLAGESRRKLAAEFGCSPGYVYLLVKQRCTDLSGRELEVLRLLAGSLTTSLDRRRASPQRAHSGEPPLDDLPTSWA